MPGNTREKADYKRRKRSKTNDRRDLQIDHASGRDTQEGTLREKDGDGLIKKTGGSQQNCVKGPRRLKRQKNGERD